MKQEKQTNIPVFKVIVIGNQDVGKSSIVGRYVKNEFKQQTKATVGVEFGKKLITVEKKQVELQIWDTAGQEQFRSMVKSFYKGAAAVFITYACNKRESFATLDEWITELDNNAHEDIVKVLVGNKCDLERLVSKEEGKQFMEKHKISLFFETSAKTGENVDEAFVECVKIIIFRMFSSENFRDAIKIMKKTPSHSQNVSRQATSRSEKSKDESLEPQQQQQQNIVLDSKQQNNKPKHKCC